MSAYAQSEAQGARYLGGWKSLLELINVEVPAESVGTELEADSSKFLAADKLRAPDAVRTAYHPARRP